MAKKRLRSADEIDPTLDDLGYLLSLVVKTVNPSISQEVAHELLVDMLETDLNEYRAVEVGALIRASADMGQTAGDMH
jgi:hypothetical protein